MSQSPSIQETNSFYKGIGMVFLVRGLARRAIRVVMRPTHSREHYFDEEAAILRAAKLACKNGWKNVVVAPDDMEGETLRAFNWHQFRYDSNFLGYPGKCVGYSQRCLRLSH